MINISYKSNPELYEDHKKCLAILSGINPESYSWPTDIVLFHQYSEVTNRKQLLAIESYFATQDQEHTKLVLWSDWNVRDNPLLAPYRERIDFRVFNPIELAKGTPLEGKNDVLLADDTKHYMKSGLLRFLALYKFGGIWFDIDMVLLRDLKPILDQEFAYVWERKFKDFTSFGPCAAFMGMKKKSEHATICIEELAKAPIIPNSVSRDCDMLKSVYRRRPFTVFPSAFFNTEWQISDKAGDKLRDGWFTKTADSTSLFLDAFAWHWHGTGGTKSSYSVPEGCKFDLIRRHTKSKLKPSISFISCSRNDGYGDGLGIYPIDGVKEVNLERVAATLRALRYINIPGQEVILVECFPAEGRPTFKEMFSEYARVITIPCSVRELLYKQVTFRMPIYEYMAKHIGAIFAKSNRLFFHNSDDILRRIGMEWAMVDIDAGDFVRGTRIGIHPDVVRNEKRLMDLVDDVSYDGIPGLNSTPNAVGDYLGVRKDIYFSSGGFRLAHGEWDVDANLLRRLQAMGIKKQQRDYFYHMEHYTKLVNQHRDTPNRAPRLAGEDHPEIKNFEWILEEVKKNNP
jgi:hypothetical protein